MCEREREREKERGQDTSSSASSPEDEASSASSLDSSYDTCVSDTLRGVGHTLGRVRDSDIHVIDTLGGVGHTLAHVRHTIHRRRRARRHSTRRTTPVLDTHLSVIDTHFRRLTHT